MGFQAKGLAILQLVPKHQDMLPNALVQALALLKHHNIQHSVYDLETAPGGEIGAVVRGLFAKIKEDTVIVSLACHFNYPKLTSLIFLYMYLPLLQGKKIYICSPYLSFYSTGRISRDNVVFCFSEIDIFLADWLKKQALTDALAFRYLPEILQERNYGRRQFWAHLTWGCRSSCSFCHNWAVAKGRPRLVYSDPENVLAWMQTARALGAQKFQFADPDFLGDQRFAGVFLDRLAKTPGVLPWRCKVRLDKINERIYEKMLAAGCDRVFFGVEHVSPRLLARMNKRAQTPRLLTEFLKYWGGRGQVDLSFLTGIGGETADDLRANLKYIARLSAVKGLNPFLGYVILYHESVRFKASKNYLVAFLLMCNFLPQDMAISRSFLKEFVLYCEQEPFFQFFLLTESVNSLELFQSLAVFSQEENPGEYFADFTRLLSLEDGRFRDIILGAASQNDCDQRVMDYVLFD